MRKERRYCDNKREDIVKFIPSNACHILDVGCGTAVMGQHIKKGRGGNVEVIGIELNPTIGEKAGCLIDKVIIGDVEQIQLPFEKEYFDCIIYGDILEHCKKPWNILKEYCNFLKRDGRIIASIPNIAHYRIIKMLKKQVWDYQDSGILDEGHLRFFTLRSIKNMFYEAGLKIIEIDRKIGASKIKRTINKIFFNFYLDSMTEQYIIVAKKSSPQVPVKLLYPIASEI